VDVAAGVAPASGQGSAGAPAGDAGSRGREPLSYIPQQRDDSLAFDLAEAAGATGAGLVVWDEAHPRNRSAPGARAATPNDVVGVIRAATLSGEPPRDVSPPESDAEMARVVPAGAGFIVVWVARRPDTAASAVSGAAAATAANVQGPATAAAAPTAIEAPGEARTFAWLEMATVDAHGAPVGPPRRLTPQTGHVSAYDVVPLPGEGKPAVLVVARDDGEAIDGSGGSLLRVKATEDAVEPPLELPADGLGRGAPSFVEAPFGGAPQGGGAPKDKPGAKPFGGGPPKDKPEAAPALATWVTWVAPHEHLRLLPIDPAGAPLAPPSSEDVITEARPLLALESGDLLFATQSSGLEVHVCPR
jgi:hypothetical protein